MGELEKSNTATQTFRLRPNNTILAISFCLVFFEA